MKVLMIPTFEEIKGSQESGIKRVCEAYYKYMPRHGIEFVGRDQERDLTVVHAGITGKDCDVAILHGLYWSADYQSETWEYNANKNIVQAVRSARQITVPSAWVAETIQRDLRVDPTVIPHGIEAEEWKHEFENEGYVLWNKNRNADVCDPSSIAYLARKYRNINFVTTYSPDKTLENIREIGHTEHTRMKQLIQRAGVYLSTTKETFGIGVLEAMASGIPVLGYKWGGNIELVKHGVNGYLADPGNVEDLMRGLEYCLKYRKTLGGNGIELAKTWTWDKPIELLYEVFRKAAYVEKPTVSVIIPTYNYAEKSKRAIDSVLDQSYKVDEIIVVDDGSSDHPEEALKEYVQQNKIKLIQKANGGVATARNRGIRESKSKYVCCLDADDMIEKDFINVCVSELEADRSLGIAYTRLRHIDKDGNSGISSWPGKFDYDRQTERANQIPTCCVFRREMWERLGGYKQRYAPQGAGAEDAEFWLRAGAYGYNARLVSDAPMFVYSLGTGAVSGNPAYREVDWLSWHPWVKDKQHPFASIAKPVKLSHPVRQYDRPTVSVIIPVGAGHENALENALDSLEAQTMRRWEAIVVWDSPLPYAAFEKSKAYPYVRLFRTSKPKSGPGVARNIGAKNARGGFLVFLDADDWLMPTALDAMLLAWQPNEAIVYTDYYGKIFIGNDQNELIKLGPKLIDHNAKTGEAVVRHVSSEYSCLKAQEQPSAGDLYHWCLVTCLIPKLWHDEIGGFDEKMESFEDVDYHWRMARKGKCYARISDPLVMYCFQTGTRRENASPYDERTRQRAIGLLEYMLKKYKDIPKMPCAGCGQHVTDRPYYPNLSQQTVTERSASFPMMNDESFVKVRYDHPNRGDHRVVGPASRIDYGYRAGGDIFLVHKDDVKASPHLFTVIEVERGKVQAPIEEKVATPEPTPLTKGESEVIHEAGESIAVLDPQSLPGVTPTVAKEMENAGINSLEKILKMGVDGLLGVKGIGKARAELIYNYAKERTGG